MCIISNEIYITIYGVLCVPYVYLRWTEMRASTLEYNNKQDMILYVCCERTQTYIQHTRIWRSDDSTLKKYFFFFALFPIVVACSFAKMRAQCLHWMFIAVQQVLAAINKAPMSNQTNRRQFVSVYDSIICVYRKWINNHHYHF